MPSGLSDFLFGKKALDKAASTGAPSQAPPSDGSGMSQKDIATLAQQQADRAKGNDSGVAARSVAVPSPSNDAAVKARAGKMADPPSHGNDDGLMKRAGR